MKVLKVLIVDDDYLNCLCLQEMISWEKMGFSHPLIAENGAEALKIIDYECPDVVISDIKMPVMDGTELSRIVYERYPNINMFFVSAYGDFETAQLAIRYNVKDYVLKPLDRKTLISLQEKISESIGQKEYSQFYQSILADDYRDVLQQALKDNDTQIIQNFFEKLKKIPENIVVRDTSFWHHMIFPIIYFKGNNENMDYSVLNAVEKRIQHEVMCLPVKQRISYLYAQYCELAKSVPMNNQIIWDIQEAIKAQYSSPDLDAGMLAQQFGISTAYLGRIFLEQTGIKVTDYILDKRMEFACEQLKNSRVAVKSIAVQAGYRDPTYFNKVFRRKTGMTPVEYREKFWYQKNVGARNEK